LGNEGKSLGNSGVKSDRLHRTHYTSYRDKILTGLKDKLDVCIQRKNYNVAIYSV
jgi:hypothetical protein